jgi:hypothetical protein
MAAKIVFIANALEPLERHSSRRGPQSAISAGTLVEPEPGRHREMARDTWM